MKNIFFWKKKKDENAVLYGTLNQRLFAVIIDLIIVIALLVPIENSITNLVYYDSMSPVQEFSSLLHKNIEPYLNKEKAGLTEFLKVYEQSYEELKNNGRLLGLIMQQSISVIALVIYNFVFWIYKQATPGKMLLSFKIVDNSTLQEPTKIQYVVRMFGYILTMLPLGLGLVYMALNKKKRGWHDLLAGTVVIKIKKQKNEK